MADVLLEETYAAYVEGDEPVENVRRMAWALRRTYLRRPSLARLITLRSNDGAAARACMAALRQSLAAMGYDESQTGRLLARTIAEVTLSHIAMTADELAQPAGTQRADLELAASSSRHPHRRLEVSDRDPTESVLADGEQVFGAALELLLEALAARAAAQQPTSKAAAEDGRARRPHLARAAPPRPRPHGRVRRRSPPPADSDAPRSADAAVATTP
ncbi:MAG: TetR/AcrR family transcriptional regulator C-terminal domain-containing protein [Candidatus Nanopelagicales bacterium]